MRKGLIVAYRALVSSSGGPTVEERTPIHVADVEKMTTDFMQRAEQGAHKDQRGRTQETAEQAPKPPTRPGGKTRRRPTLKPPGTCEPQEGEEPSDGGESSRSARRARRERRSAVYRNFDTLGEVHSIGGIALEVEPPSSIIVRITFFTKTVEQTPR